MTYKEAVTAEMDKLGQDPDVRFIGYGVKYGKAMGTLKNVQESSLIETPVAESLMVGLAIGLALRGKKPVVFIERADFLLNAMDAIVNHAAKIKLMSRGQFDPRILIRVVIGNADKPLFTGCTHTQSFYPAMCTIPGIHNAVMAEPHDASWVYDPAQSPVHIVWEYKSRF